jgi:hypothetical protein
MPGAKSNPLKKYLADLTPDAIAKLARKAKTTPASLRVLSGAYRTGGRANLSPALAGRLEVASDGALRREQLSPVCAGCPHTKKDK